MQKKFLLLTAQAVIAAPLIWAIGVGAIAYVRAPRLVAELEHAGALPFSPSELPRSRICALLVGDGDPKFFRHRGIGLADGRPGHTTITQAIGKELFFNGFSPGLLRYRKIRLMISAWAFDRRISKETQLRLFLNRAHFGSVGGKPVIGFPAAGAAFYGKPLGQLSDSEYFGLLAMLEAPKRYHVILQPKANAERVAWIRHQVQRVWGRMFSRRSPNPMLNGSPLNCAAA